VLHHGQIKKLNKKNMLKRCNHVKKKGKKQCLMIKTKKKYAKKIMTIKISKFNYIQLIKSLIQVI